MEPSTSSIPLNAPGAADAAVRRNDRLRCHRLDCELGEVVDMSSSGMRVRMRGRRGLSEEDRFNVRIDASCGQLTVPARVVWLRRVGILSFEAGLEFHELSPEMRAAVNSVARSATARESLRKSA